MEKERRQRKRETGKREKMGKGKRVSVICRRRKGEEEREKLNKERK